MTHLFTRKSLFNLLAPFLGLLVVIGLFSADPEIREYFLSGRNFKIIFVQTVIVATAALGMTMIIVSGGIDLSVGSVVALCTVVAARLAASHQTAAATVLATIAVGGLIGAVNGSLITGLRVTPFIVTLGTMGICRGLAKWLSNSQTVLYDDSPINRLMVQDHPDTFFPLPLGVWITVGLAVLTAALMSRTIFGQYTFAIGSNEATARLCGVRVPFYKITIYAAAGLMFGIAGLFQTSRLNLGDPSIAIGLELDVIAAVVIGGASLRGGSGSVLGSMIGALIMAVLRNGSSQMGWPNYIQDIIIGAVIIAAVALDRLRTARRE